MTKADLTSSITNQTGLEKADIEATINALFATIKESLSNGETIYLRGFGSFQNKKRAAKVARNIKKNTTVFVEAHSYPSFKPSKIFTQQVKTQATESV